jgi:hypothetical protein
MQCIRGAVTSWLKQTGRGADHFYIEPSLRMRGALPLLRTCLHGVHRDFTFVGVVYKVKIENRIWSPRQCVSYLISGTSSPVAIFSWNLVWEFFTISYYVSTISVKIGSVTAILYLGVWMNSCLYFLHALADLGEVQCRVSTSNASGTFWVSWKSVPWKPYLIIFLRFG